VHLPPGGARDETRTPPRFGRIEDPATIEHPNSLDKVRQGGQVHSPDLGFRRSMSTRLGTLEHRSILMSGELVHKKVSAVRKPWLRARSA